MVRKKLDKEKIISRTGIADTKFADHSGNIQQGYKLGSLTEGLVAYYPMEKGEGQVLHDAALNNLGQINGASWTSDSQVGDNALSFDGNDNVGIGESGDVLSQINNDFTVSLWVNLDKLASTIGNNVLPLSLAGSIKIQIDSSDDRIRFALYDGSSTVNVFAPAVSINSWIHITGIFDGSTMRIFKNGILEDSANHNSPVYQANPERIASDRGDTKNVDGQIDDVRIYDRALSQPEIEALYNLTSPQGELITEKDVPTLQRNRYGDNINGAVARYKFDGDVTDSWGDNDGTDNTSAGYVSGVYGQAKDFDGSDDYISTPLESLSPPFTVSSWLRLNDKSANRWAFSNFNSSNRDFYLGYNASGDALQVGWDAGTQSIAEKSITPKTGDWNFMCATIDARGRRRLYMNAVNVVDRMEKVVTYDNGLSFEFGRHPNGNDSPWDGAIDDVRIYNREFSPREVEQLFNKGAYRISRGDL